MSNIPVFMLYFFLLNPLASWVSSPNRKWHARYGLIFGCSILFIAGVFPILHDAGYFALFGYKPENKFSDAYYTLGLSPGASDHDARRAYKSLSLQFHPDKISGLSEPQRDSMSAKYLKIRQAYEFLHGQSHSAVYNLFGDFTHSKDSSVMVDRVFDARETLLFEVVLRDIIQLFSALVYSFIFSIGDRAQNSHPSLTYSHSNGISSFSLYLSFLILCFCLNIQMRFDDRYTSWLASVPVLSSLATFERINAVKSLSTTMISLFMMISQFNNNQKKQIIDTRVRNACIFVKSNVDLHQKLDHAISVSQEKNNQLSVYSSDNNSSRDCFVKKYEILRSNFSNQDWEKISKGLFDEKDQQISDKFATQTLQAFDQNCNQTSLRSRIMWLIIMINLIGTDNIVYGINTAKEYFQL